MNKTSFSFPWTSLLKDFPLAHLPTLMILIGYPVYWLELYFLKSPQGMCSFLAVELFAVLSLGAVYLQREEIVTNLRNYGQQFLGLKKDMRALVLLAGGISLCILSIVLLAARLPPHLMQEYDALNYHITIPRQHLILHSFKHIPWSSADFFLLPVQFALTPFWLVTSLPNKFPQFFLFLGLIATSVSIVRRTSKDYFFPATILVFAVLGTHGFGVQMGTAMLDLAMAYLLIAAIDSFLRGHIFLSATEFTFCFWSKSFVPIQTAMIFFILWILKLILQNLESFKLQLLFNGDVKVIRTSSKKFLLLFFILSLGIGAPFVVKSLYYTATPFYPFGVGKMMLNSHIDTNSLEWKSVVASAQEHLKTKDQYGSPRTVLEFIKHFWLLAVPEKGVNNRFDYPLGLTYLIFTGPFLVQLIQSVRERRYNVMAWFVVVWWGLWWLGSQQSRFLFIPLMLIFILAVPMVQPSRILMIALIMALGLNALSLIRAHRKDLLVCRPQETLREKDRGLLRMNELYLTQNTGQKVPLEYHDVAFARFPVVVIKEKLPYVLYVDHQSSSEK